MRRRINENPTAFSVSVKELDVNAKMISLRLTVNEKNVNMFRLSKLSFHGFSQSYHVTSKLNLWLLHFINWLQPMAIEAKKDRILDDNRGIYGSIPSKSKTI